MRLSPTTKHYVFFSITIGVNISSQKRKRRGKSIRSWCDGSSDRSLMVNPLNYFSFQSMFHDSCNEHRGMYYHVCGMVLFGKCSPSSGGSGFSLLLFELSFTICPTPYVRRHITVKNMFSESLNKTFPFLPATTCPLLSNNSICVSLQPQYFLCSKDRGMWYPFSGLLLLIVKKTPCSGGSAPPPPPLSLSLSLSLFFTICQTPYNSKEVFASFL